MEASGTAANGASAHTSSACIPAARTRAVDAKVIKRIVVDAFPSLSQRILPGYRRLHIVEARQRRRRNGRSTRDLPRRHFGLGRTDLHGARVWISHGRQPLARVALIRARRRRPPLTVLTRNDAASPRRYGLLGNSTDRRLPRRKPGANAETRTRSRTENSGADTRVRRARPASVSDSAADRRRSQSVLRLPQR